MSAGIPLKHYSGGDSFDVIVVGSGMGGLTTARMLARHGGKRVLVLERHYTAGGFTHVFRRPGFEWDVGLHYIGDVHRPGSFLRRAFDHLTDGAVAWQAMDPVYDRVLVAGRRYDLAAGEGAFRDMLVRAFPAEARGIDRYLSTLKRCNRVMSGFFIEKSLPQLLAAVLGGILRAPYLRHARRTTLEVLRSLTRDPELIGVLTAQYLDYGLPPGKSSFGIHAAIALHYMEGAGYPVGGAGAIAAAIAPLIERAGGAVLVDAEVTEILVENGAATGVRTRDGRAFRAPVVASDAGLRMTLRLLPPAAPGREAMQGIVDRVGPSCAHLSLYVGLDRTAQDLGLRTTNLWVFPGPDHDANVAAYDADPDAPFPAVYISFPSAKDPDFEHRHPGHATIEALTLAPFGRFARWADTRWRRRGSEYEALKQALADRLLEHVYAQVPAARGHVIHAELSTPLSTRHFSNYENGEIYGLSSTPARFLERGLRPRTAIRGLYLTGQDSAGLGVAQAMFGGVLSASLIVGRNLMREVTKP